MQIVHDSGGAVKNAGTRYLFACYSQRGWGDPRWVRDLPVDAIVRMFSPQGNGER